MYNNYIMFKVLYGWHSDTNCIVLLQLNILVTLLLLLVTCNSSRIHHNFEFISHNMGG